MLTTRGIIFTKLYQRYRYRANLRRELLSYVRMYKNLRCFINFISNIFSLEIWFPNLKRICLPKYIEIEIEDNIIEKIYIYIKEKFFIKLFPEN